MKVLIHDISNLDINYFDKFKDLEVVHINTAKDFMRNNWHLITDIFDGSTKFEFYKNMLKNNEEHIFKAGVNFILSKSKKYYHLPNLKNLQFAEKKESFSDEDFKTILKNKDNILKSLEYVCGSYKNLFEKELDELEDKPIDISELTINNEKMYFVKDKRKYADDDNVIDLNSLLLLKDLKEILENKI